MRYYKLYIIILSICLLTIFNNATASNNDNETYETILTKHLTLHQEYPTSGKLYGLEGDIIIRLQVNKQGQIISHKIVHKSKHPVFNKAIDKMVENANPTPPPPANYFTNNQNIVEFMLPIAFRQKDNAMDLSEIDRLFQEQSQKALLEPLTDTDISQ